MKRKATPVREPDGFWKIKRESKSTLERSGRVEVQSIGFGPNGECVCAGVHWCNDLSARWAWRIYHNWRRWRRWYDSLPWNTHDYPAKHGPAVAAFVIHPINKPNNRVVINTQPM